MRLGKELRAPEKDEAANPTYLYCAMGGRNKKKKKKDGGRKRVGWANQGLAFLNGKTEEGGLAALHFAASEGHKWETLWFPTFLIYDF